MQEIHFLFSIVMHLEDYTDNDQENIEIQTAATAKDLS